MGTSETLLLLENASASNAVGAVAQLGGRYVFAIAGTFGGTSAQLEVFGPNPAGSTWIAITGAVFTADGTVSLDVAKGSALRVTLTGGTPSGMYARATRAPQG